ncbi:MAG: hypothetical protein IJM82_03115 [Synergistaceae bacterium]|nr:hypothetical protein [Synergistaceae bacterium]
MMFSFCHASVSVNKTAVNFEISGNVASADINCLSDSIIAGININDIAA